MSSVDFYFQNQHFQTNISEISIRLSVWIHIRPTLCRFLLNIFNYIWTTGKFPEDWTLATIIPIPKPGKDPAEPNNYRPIALTSCLCKTLERMINKRLTWFFRIQ